METLIIAAADVAQIVKHYGRDTVMDQVITRLEDTFLQAAEAGFDLPIRQGFQYGHPADGLLEWMPVMETGSRATLKVVAYTPSNPTQRGLPTVIGTIHLYDTATGHLEAIADGVLLTAMRTGAASAIASRRLAHPDSRTLGLVGCGMQAVTQAHALCRTFPIERILVHDEDPVVEASFADRTAFLGKLIERTPLAEVERQADILCTATSVAIGAGPVIGGDVLKPHLHLNAVGSDFAGKVEIPRRVLERSLVIPDFKAQAVREGECQQLDDSQIGPDLAELLASEPAADHRESLTVFDSTGSAIEDHAIMQLVLQLARHLGVGESVSLEHLPRDYYDPYDMSEPLQEALGAPGGKATRTTAREGRPW